LVHRKTTSAVKRNLTADVSDNMAYTVLRGHRHAIAIPNVHASTQDVQSSQLCHSKNANCQSA